MATCALCGAPIRIKRAHTGRARLLCRTRLEDPGACANRLTYLDVYEAQIADYLGAFHLPEDDQGRLLTAMRGMAEPADDDEQQRRGLEARLERIKELYDWGDYSRERYLSERAALQEQLRALGPRVRRHEDLEAAAALVRDVRAGWALADQARRNQLARTIFEDILVHDDRVVGVKPRAGLARYFELSHAGWLKEKTPGNSAGGGTPRTSGGSDGLRFRRSHILKGAYDVLWPSPSERPGSAVAAVPRREASLTERNRAIRERALTGAPWPILAAEFGVSPTRVRQICDGLPARRSGRPGGRSRIADAARKGGSRGKATG